MKLSTFVSLLLLVVIVVVLTMFVFKGHKKAEKFEESIFKPVQITGINSNYCSRNVNYANQATDPNMLASFRTLKATNVTNTSTSCNFPDNVQEDLAVVHENYLYYSMKYACLALYIRDIKSIENGKIELTLNTENLQQKRSLITMLLLNPMFIEFDYNELNKTIAYFIMNNFQNLSNYDGDQTVTITLNPITNSDFFKYNTSYKTLMDIKSQNQRIDLINARVYYLDTPCSSSSNTGRVLNLTSDFISKRGQAIKVYDKTIGTTTNDTKKKDPNYLFFNRFTILYGNNIAPALTLKFQINRYKKSETRTILRIYMGNSLQYSSNKCWPGVDDSFGPSNNNILSIVATPSGNEFFRLYFITGTQDQCHNAFLTNRSPNQQSLENDKDTLVLDLPKERRTQLEDSMSENINILLTITPAEKFAAAYWNDPITGATNCKVSKKKGCGTTNNFYKLFSDTSKPPLSDINLNYTSDVTSLSSIAHGYINFQTEIFTI